MFEIKLVTLPPFHAGEESGTTRCSEDLMKSEQAIGSSLKAKKY